MTFWKQLDLKNTGNWAYSELVQEVIRLRTISERQSSMLAQALFEKNHVTTAANAATEAFIAKLEKHNAALQKSHDELKSRFYDVEKCHKADFELLNRLKSVLKDLAR